MGIELKSINNASPRCIDIYKSGWTPASPWCADVIFEDGRSWPAWQQSFRTKTAMVKNINTALDSVGLPDLPIIRVKDKE